MLFRLTSEFFKTKLHVYYIKIDVEVIRLGILVDGVDTHQKLILNGATSDVIENEMTELLKLA